MKITDRHFKPESLEYLNSINLLNCPFCGKEPSVGCHDPGAPYLGGYYYIACENEDCLIDDILVDIKSITENELSTIKDLAIKWNTRNV